MCCDDGLSEAQAAVACGNLGMRKHFKAVVFKILSYSKCSNTIKLLNVPPLKQTRLIEDS